MKVLVIHATAGAGHFKAAEAIYLSLRDHTSHQATLADALDYTPAYFKNSYRETYAFLVSHLSWLWGGIFKFLDFRWIRPLLKIFRRCYNVIHTRRLCQFLIKEQFDCVISTHFMPIEVTAALKRQGKIHSTLISVVTDYDVHQIWLADEVNLYAVASDWTKEKMKTMNIPENKIAVTGIPTNEKFAAPLDKKQMKKTLGLNPQEFTVLIATGSFGIGPIEKIIQHLPQLQIMVVCGHNKNLYEKLKPYHADKIKIFGLVNNMEELMSAADAMLTKPGGLSVTEAMVKHLPMIFFNAIPGQETGNVRVLGLYGIGTTPQGIAGIVAELEKMHSSKEYFEDLRAKSTALARVSAAESIARLIG
jgi:processive 1,2-diacylglycerol beta-glucosyltransferase